VPTVLVLGASRGIGHEFVRQYRADGWRVIATARDDAAIARLEAAGCEAFRLDVTDPASNAAVEWRIESERIDVALYVAGVMSRGNAQQPPTREEFDRVMHTNVLGAMQLIPSVAPRVAAAHGRFVFISSLMASIAELDSTYGCLYRVSKAALNMAVHAAQFDYPDAMLAVMNPGWVKTDMGGAGAPLEVAESVGGMRRVIAGMDASAKGAFLRWDGGRTAW
jgi:NAD(P)-dependent dehydrogenase (short-subunit alcohol dehydrogenase family)